MTGETPFEAARAFQAGGRITSVRIGDNPYPNLMDILRDYAFHPAPPGTYSPYTPAEELRDRLNTRAQGKDPGHPINTNYWKGPHHGRQL